MAGQSSRVGGAMGRTLEPEDLLALDIISDARLSPDGKRVAYAAKRARLEHNDYTSAIYLTSTLGDPASDRLAEQRFTEGAHRDTAPRWSPDGRSLAFVSDRSGVAQLYVIRLDGGEPRQLTHLRRGVGDPVWSPDSRWLAFLSTEGNGDEDAPARSGDPIRRLTGLRYRFNEVGYIDGRYQHLWIVEASGGEPRQLTRGDQDDLAPAWSPDGAWLAFVSNREGEADAHSVSQLYVVSARGTGGAPGAGAAHGDGARRICRGTEMAMAPAWSPDGSRVAYIGRREGAPAGANNAVYAAPAAGGPAACEHLTGDFDRSPGTGVYSDTWSVSGSPALFWSPDGGSLYFTACDRGRVSLFRTTGAGGAELVVGGDRTLAFVSSSAAGDRFAYAAGDFTTPCDLYTCSADGAAERRLTALNAARLDEVALGAPEPMPFPGPGGDYLVDAWLLRPVGFEASRRYPLVQIIHGGPHSIFGHVFFFDMQLWAHRGWNVLFVNPRASQGYGESFATANIGDWGVGDWPEQEAALDLAIARGGVDPERLAVTGLSYGGFMTNWIIGHSARYRAAVSENGISNLVSFFGTSDIGWHWLEDELRDDVWGNLDYYMDRSPIRYVPQMQTPTLLLQAEADWRCPVEQGEQLYTALLARGVPCEMVRFPGESHAFLSGGKPQSRLERRRHTLRWFEAYL